MALSYLDMMRLLRLLEMSQTEKKVKWCLGKAERELQNAGKHRGLVRIKPDGVLVNAHIRKAEHNLSAIEDFKNIGYSDWSASAVFYSVYHCFLAIITKYGYESRNQECTFALIYYLIETNKINMDKEIIERVYSLNPDEKHKSPTVIEIRETEQYGVNLSLEDESYQKLQNIAKVILDQTKEILESDV